MGETGKGQGICELWLFRFWCEVFEFLKVKGIYIPFTFKNSALFPSKTEEPERRSAKSRIAGSTGEGTWADRNVDRMEGPLKGWVYFTQFLRRRQG